MTLSHRNIMCGFALLMSTTIACDDSAPEPSVELRDGEVVQFKTASVDQTFKWKGCEPPWGPWPYKEVEPSERWREEVGGHIAVDAGAHVLSGWLEDSRGLACDEGCASLDLRWTGEARAVEVNTRIRSAEAFGRCEGDDFAYGVDVAASAAFECTCG